MVGSEPPVMARPASRLDLDDLRRESLQSLASLMLLAGAVGAWYYLPNEDFHWRQVALFLATLLVAAAAGRLGEKWPIAGLVLLVAGEYTLAFGASLLLPGVSTLLFCLPVATSVLAVWAPAPLAAAALACAGQYAVAAVAGRPPLLALSVGVYAVLGVTLYMASGSLQHALTWSWHRHAEALALSEQLRNRQGELNRAVEALDLAYRLLQRTNHELAEARQEADEARHLKEQFAANISHELRTPLNLILGFSEMMHLSPHVYGDSDWSPALRSDIAQVYAASRHLSQLVDDVLDLSRLDAERMPLRRELVSLGNIIVEAVDTARELSRGREISISVELDQAVPQPFADATRIRQVMLNLLHNAIRFTDEGGITVRTQLMPGEVLISVADTGVGIAEAELERIFDEFYQAERTSARSNMGMGLGLAIAKRFVSMHGGRIWCESRVGKGSTFYVALPLDASRPAFSRLRTSRPAPLPQSPYGESVVLLGAGRDVARLLERHLGSNEQQFTVVLAEGPEEAGRLVAEHHPRAVIHNLSLAELRAIAASLIPPLGMGDVPVLHAALPCGAWRAELLGAYASLQKPVERADVLPLLRALPEASDVLVVDDDLGFASVLARMIESLVSEDGRKIRVRAAFDGNEGLEEMRRQVPDLLFLDLRMPEPDGVAVLSAMRSDLALSRVPVVVVTAGDAEEEEGIPVTGFVAVSQRQRWSLGHSLKALASLMGVTQPLYGVGEVERERRAASSDA